MRVIAGKCKRLILNTIPGDNTRPTTDRIKETLFNMINEEVVDSDFLDLYAGSGQIGIEALSRYARHATFVDNNKKAIECINNNLMKCSLEDEADVINSNCLSALKRFDADSYDIIFLDPPYNKGYEREVLEYLSESNILRKDGLIIVEADLKSDFSYVEELSFTIVRDKKYKTNRHLFIRNK